MVKWLWHKGLDAQRGASARIVEVAPRRGHIWTISGDTYSTRSRVLALPGISKLVATSL